MPVFFYSFDKPRAEVIAWFFLGNYLKKQHIKSSGGISRGLPLKYFVNTDQSASQELI